MNLPEKIKKNIEEIISAPILKINPVGGGCISDAYKLVDSLNNIFFLKLNRNLPKDMFHKEANGLKELKKAKAIRIPEIIYSAEDFILIEFIDSSKKSKNFFENFGRKFAGLHKFEQKNFGFFEDNYIGSNIQKNIPENSEKDNWAEFYFNQRILFQYNLAEKNGYASSELKTGIKELEKKIDKILEEKNPAASLLHGDLWSGNFISDEDGEACLIDPAVYYGDREADLAMTKLFGGFSSDFYSAYNEFYPLREGYKYRENIYKLYHVLNHLNLFGSGYYGQALNLIRFYL
jgi:protein-ribulosamine 3-kinase